MNSDRNDKMRGLHNAPDRSKARPHALPTLGEQSCMPRWISIAGLELGTDRAGFCNQTPGKLGTDYYLNSSKTLHALAHSGFECFRIPFRWERLQPQLGGPLDPDGLQHLRLLLSVAKSVDVQVILDLHNFGSYTKWIDGVPVACGIDQEVNGQIEVTTEHFGDLWTRMGYAMSGLPNIVGYNLMHRPTNLPEGTWIRASQYAVESLRAEGDVTPIHIAGNAGSLTSQWKDSNPSNPWIHDPKNLITYEAACYLDQDQSGDYALPYDKELAFDPDLKDRATRRLKPFLRWLSQSGATGAISEFGVPADCPQWTKLLPGMLRDLDQNKVQTTWSAAGEQSGDSPLSLQPKAVIDELPLAQVELFRS